jgi:predicted Rossmann-fold nucleotide-binding protein
MFEQLTLIQTKKIKPRAFVLVDEKYYKNLLNFINDMAKSKSISKADRELITLANDADSVVKAILDKYETKRKKKYI